MAYESFGLEAPLTTPAPSSPSPGSAVASLARGGDDAASTASKRLASFDDRASSSSFDDRASSSSLESARGGVIFAPRGIATRRTKTRARGLARGATRATRGGTRGRTRAEALDGIDARTVGARRSMMRASRGLGTRERERGVALDDARAMRAVTGETKRTNGVRWN